MKEFNIPFMPYYWIKLIELSNGKYTNVFGRYLSYCKLRGFKNFNFFDSEYLQEI